MPSTARTLSAPFPNAPPPREFGARLNYNTTAHILLLGELLKILLGHHDLYLFSNFVTLELKTQCMLHDDNPSLIDTALLYIKYFKVLPY